MELHQLVRRLKESFKNPLIQEQVLENEWLTRNRLSGIPETGFCDLASSVIFILDWAADKWVFKKISKKDWSYWSHYYLELRSTQEVLDITKEQYIELWIDIPYHLWKEYLEINSPDRVKLLAKLSGLGDIL